jgi:hypothetical protein
MSSIGFVFRAKARRAAPRWKPRTKYQKVSTYGYPRRGENLRDGILTWDN